MAIYLNSIRLSGIRSFSRPTSIPLFSESDETKILTISGPNGSGKSAIVESISAVQRAGILSSLPDVRPAPAQLSDLRRSFSRRLQNLVANRSASVDLTIGQDGEEGEGTLTLEISKTKNRTRHTLQYEGALAQALVKQWTKSDPDNLIVSIPSTKFFNQEDIIFTQVKKPELEIKGFGELDREQVLKPLTLDPPLAIREAYRKIAEDWLYERVVPGRQRPLYNTLAKIFLTKLFPYVSIANFSATLGTGEILCLAKRLDHQSRSYDVRSLSSGEKYIFFLFSLIVRYAGRAMAILLDEPENHLHEATLIRFLELMYQYTNRESDFPLQVSEMGKSIGMEIPKKQLEALVKQCSRRPLVRSAILMTHSKLLIRRNFGYGPNILLSDLGAERLAGGETEEKLRVAGLSQIDERVIFVEGPSDEALFKRVFSDVQVEIRPLTGKKSVCTAFEGLAIIDPHKRHPAYAFLLDQDLVRDIRYERLRERYPTVWEQHVVVLERAELENYLLEPKLFKRALKRLLVAEEWQDQSELDDEDKIDEILLNAANETYSSQKQRFLNSLLRIERIRFFDLPRSRDLPAGNDDGFSNFLDDFLSQEKLRDFRNSMLAAYRECESQFTNEEWSSHWRSRCKGKQALILACRSIADRIDFPIYADLIKHRVILEAAHAADVELREIIDRLKRILRITGAGDA